MCIVIDQVALRSGNPRQAAQAIEALIAPLRSEPGIYGIGVHFDQKNPETAVISALCEDASIGRKLSDLLKRRLPKAFAAVRVKAEIGTPEVYVAADRLRASKLRRRAG